MILPFTGQYQLSGLLASESVTLMVLEGRKGQEIRSSYMMGGLLAIVSPFGESGDWGYKGPMQGELKEAGSLCSGSLPASLLSILVSCSFSTAPGFL